MPEWVTTDVVKSWMGDEGAVVDEGLELALAAAVSFVETDAASPLRRPELWSLADLEADPPVLSEFIADDQIIQGTAMLAARWYSRRSSLTGTTQGYGEFGTGSILRYDPDIARLLRIGNFQAFGFGAPPVETVAPDPVL